MTRALQWSMLVALPAIGLASVVSCSGPSGAARAAPPGAPATRITERIDPTPPRSGLEVRRMFVPVDPRERSDAIAAAIESGLCTRLRSVGAGTPPSALESAGFEVLRTTYESLPALIESLGGTRQVHSTLLGTLADWSDLETVRFDGGRVVFVAGRPRDLQQCVVRLWMRGWTFPTVDGGRARIELRLSSADSRLERATLDPTAVRPRPRDFDGGRTIAELAPDEVLVLLEKPIVPPERSESDALAALPPPSLAAIMLAERGIEGRATVLVVTAGFEGILPASDTRPAAGTDAGAPTAGVPMNGRQPDAAPKEGSGAGPVDRPAEGPTETTP